MRHCWHSTTNGLVFQQVQFLTQLDYQLVALESFFFTHFMCRYAPIMFFSLHTYTCIYYVCVCSSETSAPVIYMSCIVGKIKVRPYQIICTEVFAQETHSRHPPTRTHLFRKENYDAIKMCLHYKVYTCAYVHVHVCVCVYMYNVMYVYTYMYLFSPRTYRETHDDFQMCVLASWVASVAQLLGASSRMMSATRMSCPMSSNPK